MASKVARGSSSKHVKRSTRVAGGAGKLKTAVEARDIVLGLQKHGVTQVVIAEATQADTRSVYSWKEGASPRRPRYDRLAALRDVVTALEDSLTHKGIVQWLQARNRYLDGKRPVDVLAEGRVEEVVEAANAYAEGVYL